MTGRSSGKNICIVYDRERESVCVCVCVCVCAYIQARLIGAIFQKYLLFLRVYVSQAGDSHSISDFFTVICPGGVAIAKVLQLTEG